MNAKTSKLKIDLVEKNLFNEYGSFIHVDDMAKILGKTSESMRIMISSKRCPFPLTKLGQKRVTTPYDVATYVILNQQ